MEKTTKTINVTAYPYAIQHGTIEVPNGIDESEIEEYVMEHFDEIKFNNAELDYCGTDIDYTIG